MNRSLISPSELLLKPIDTLATNWALLTAGDWASRRFNCMTISWASIGRMWEKPFAMVVVRPQRYTHQFMDEFDSFTVCVLPTRYRPTLETLGTRSGRDMDKINASGLTPTASVVVA